ncbi:hypothetical protein M9458_029015, partial [Cirrhinus mrigala]
SAAFTQTAGQEVGRRGSGDGAQEPLPNPNQPLSQELPGYIAPLPSELAVSVGRAAARAMNVHPPLTEEQLNAPAE